MTQTMSIAETIYQQLGGGKFATMTGAKNFVAGKNFLEMTLPKNHSRANRLRVTLNGMDLYDMRFYRFTPMRLNHKTFTVTPEKVEEVAQYNDVFCDQLQELFTETTWMYTRLF